MIRQILRSAGDHAGPPADRHHMAVSVDETSRHTVPDEVAGGILTPDHRGRRPGIGLDAGGSHRRHQCPRVRGDIPRPRVDDVVDPATGVGPGPGGGTRGGQASGAQDDDLVGVRPVRWCNGWRRPHPNRRREAGRPRPRPHRGSPGRRTRGSRRCGRPPGQRQRPFRSSPRRRGRLREPRSCGPTGPGRSATSPVPASAAHPVVHRRRRWPRNRGHSRFRPGPSRWSGRRSPRSGRQHHTPSPWPRRGGGSPVSVGHRAVRGVVAPSRA